MIIDLDEGSILGQLRILRDIFDEYWAQWSRLGQEREFISLPHRSDARSMFGEGKSAADYLSGALDNTNVGTYVLLNDYVANVQNCIPPWDWYCGIGFAAEKEWKNKFQENSTVGSMLRIYKEQHNHILQVGRLLDALRHTRAYRLLEGLPKGASPMQVIAKWAKMWEGDSQLHSDHGETSLRAQLTAALRSAGFMGVSEAQVYQGHADIVIPPKDQAGWTSGSLSGNQLVVECKFWTGEAAFDDAIAQLCRYVTPNDQHAALIIFVRQASFMDIVEKAKAKLRLHPAFRGWDHSSEVDYGFNLRPAQNLSVSVSATLLVCNLGIARY